MEKLNFNCQFLLLEKNLNYEGFEDRYLLIQHIAKKVVKDNFRKIKSRISLLGLARDGFNKNFILDSTNSFKANTKAEKLLLASNILFHDEDNFIDTVINKYKISSDNLLLLKDELNELDLKNKEELGNKVDELIELYIPNFQNLIIHYGINSAKELILVKLLEIVYLRPEQLGLEIKKQK